MRGGSSLLHHLLVVDDETSIHEAVAMALADRYVVHTATSGAEAVSILLVHPIAGIILDAILQDEHGLDLVPRFRQLSAAPILVLTGQGSEALAARGIWTGVDGYLNKPVSVAALHTAMAQLLHQPEGQGDLAARARCALDAYPPTRFRAAEFARQLGASEMHLRRRFRAAYGFTPNQYLTAVRLDRAALRLQTTDHGVAEIAFDVGFPHVAWFTKCFRGRFGHPPGAYRTEPAAADATQGRPTPPAPDA